MNELVHAAVLEDANMAMGAIRALRQIADEINHALTMGDEELAEALGRRRDRLERLLAELRAEATRG